MTPHDSEGKQLPVHSIVGSLRSRISDLKSGNFTKAYSLEVYYNGMQYYVPYLNVGLHIHAYSPTEITENLKPLLLDLNSIKPKHFAHLENEAEEFSEKPTYNAILEEIHFYRVQISKLLDQYRSGDSGPFFTLKYEAKGKNRLTKLVAFYRAISDEVANLDLEDVYDIFSGKSIRIKNPIDWQGNINEIVYLFNELTERDDVTFRPGTKWDSASNCFAYKGDPITIDDRGHYRIKTVERRKEINSILDRLN